MGQSPEELREEIESTRADLGETVDAIGDRVSPGRMIERRTNRMRQSFRGARDRVMGVAHDTMEGTRERMGSGVDTLREARDSGSQATQGSPLVAGALAFGVGFLVAAVVPRTQAEAQLAPQLADRVEPLKHELSEAREQAAEQLREPARQAASEVKETAVSGAQQVAEQARHGAEDTKQAGRQAANELRQ
jgi:Protein of unknown function (DUF3618)